MHKPLLPFGNIWVITAKQTKAEGERRFATLTTPEGLHWKKFYEACIENCAGHEEKAWELRQELLKELPEGDKMRANIYAIIGDELDNDETKLPNKLSIMKRHWL